jgi:hypothetical protein
MDYPIHLLRLVVKGSQFSVYALVRDGRSKALEFLEWVDEADNGHTQRADKAIAEPERRIKARYMLHIRSYADTNQLKFKHGHPMDPKKPPGDQAKGLFGFKDNQSQTRLLAFNSKFGRVLSHGFGEKKEDEFPVTEIKRADAERNWFEGQLATWAAAVAKANQGGKR